MFTVDNNFEVGQEVYVIKKEKRKITNEQTCDVCLGRGVFDYKGYTVNCPKCKTRGKIEIDSIYVPVFNFDRIPHKITSIRYMVYDDKKSNMEAPLKYKINGKFVPEKYIAATWEEAVKICDELNGVDIDGMYESANHHYLVEE